MAVPTSFTDLSTTPATNATYISGSDSPIVLDDHLRTVYALIASVYANSGNGWAAPYLPAANPSYTGTLTGGTGIVNLGSGQFYKAADGKISIGGTTGTQLVETFGGTVRVNRATSTYTTGVILEATSALSSGDFSPALVFSGANQNAAIWSIRKVSYGGDLVFATQGTSIGDPAERARIDSNGYLLVGYTTSNGAYRLQVNSQIFATSSTVATSDGRYKQNVTTLAGALAVVNALRPVSFDWKPHPVHNFSRDRAVGFIAQEVRAALDGTGYGPAIVKTNNTVMPDGTDESFLGIAEGNLIAVLTAAMQELATQVQALTTKTQALEAVTAKPRRQKQAKAAN